MLLFSLPCRAADDEQKIKINFAGLDLATVAKQVERVTKRTFLFDDNLLRTKRVTLQSDSPINAAEFYRVFQSVCQLNGLAIVPVEGTGGINLEKIVNAQAAQKEPGAQPVIVRGEALPAGDATVSYLVKLQHAPATKVLAALTPELSPTGAVIQVPNSDLLLINDAASSVKRLEKIIALVDVVGDPVSAATLRITNLTAERAQTLLNEYMQAMSKAKSGDSSRDRLSIVKDERMNTLYLLGSEADVAVAQVFLKTLDVDAPAARRTIRYYKLKNVPVKEIVDYVGELLGLALGERAAEVKAQQAQQAQNGALVPAPKLVLPPPIAPTPGFTPALPPPIPQVLEPVYTGAPVVNATKGHEGSKAGAGKPNAPADIIAVDSLNMLVVAGDESVHKEVASILENLDRRKGQVLIEVAIVQVSSNDNLDLGTEFLSINDLGNRQADGGTGFGLGTQSDATGTGTTPSTTTGTSASTIPLRGFPTQSILGSVAGSAFRFTKGDKFQLILSALSSKSHVSIVSQPLLLVNDNEEASFTTKVSQPTVTTSQGTATTNTAFSGFADATTSLKITPHISPDGYMNLEIVQTVEEFTGAAAGAGVPPPHG
jgi:general secretion pathway protein D